MTLNNDWLLFRLSVCLLPFVSLASLIGFSLFSVKNIFKKIFLTTYSRKLIYTYILIVSFLFLVSCIGSYDKLESFSVSMNFYPFFLFFIAILNTFNAYMFKQISIYILISSTPVMLLTIVEFAFNQYDFYDLFFKHSLKHPTSISVFTNSNFLAGYLVILLGLSLGALIGCEKYNYCLDSSVKLSNSRSLFLIKTYVCFNLLAISCSQSRNGLLVSIIILCLYSAMSNKSKNLYFACFMLILIVTCFYLTKNVAMFKYYSGEFPLTPGALKEISSFSIDTRTRIWRIALSLGEQKPLFGWGFGSYKLLYPIQDIGAPSHPHNLWLMLFAETGIMGLISLNVFIGYILYRSIKRIHLIGEEERSILISYLMSFSSSIMFHFFDCPFFDARINCLNWILLAGIFFFSSMES
jgi:O-antigen ligase